MTRDENATQIGCGSQRKPTVCSRGERKRCIGTGGRKVCETHLTVAGMGHHETRCERLEKTTTRGSRLQHVFSGGFHREDAETLFGNGVFRHTIEMVECRLCRPADIERGGDVTVRPIHKFAKRFPIAHVFKSDLFQWSTGDDEAARRQLTQLREREIEGADVVLGSVFEGLTVQAKETETERQSGAGTDSCEVKFGGRFDGHEVQNRHVGEAGGWLRERLQGDFAHIEAFVSQNFCCGKMLGKKNQSSWG